MFFSIDDEVFRRLPALCVGVVLAEGVDGAGEHPAVDALLDEAVRDAERRLEGVHASEDPRVQPYRAAFHELGMSPSRYPSSNIALLRRIAKGKGLWRVNPIDGFMGVNENEVRAACEELAATLRDECGASAETYLLNAAEPRA